MHSHSQHRQIHECTFTLQVVHGTGNIRFPCSFFVLWQTANGKQVSAPSKRVKKNGQMIPFDDTLTLTTYLCFDTLAQSYNKKQANILVNLVSNSRPNEPKLVGRVTVDLAELISSDKFNQIKQYPLEYCSVNGSLTFSAGFVSSTPTTLSVHEMERSDFGQFEMQGSEKSIKQPQTKKQGSSNSFEGRQKTMTFRESASSSVVGQRPAIRSKTALTSSDVKSPAFMDTVSPRVKRQLESRGITLDRPFFGTGANSRAQARTENKPKLEIDVEEPAVDEVKPQIVVSPPATIQSHIQQSPSIHDLAKQPSPEKKGNQKYRDSAQIELLEAEIQRLSQQKWKMQVEKATMVQDQANLKAQVFQLTSKLTTFEKQTGQLTIMKQRMKDLNDTVAEQYNQLRRISDENYPQQIQVLTETISLTEQQANRWEEHALEQQEQISVLITQNNRLKEDLEAQYQEVTKLTSIHAQNGIQKESPVASPVRESSSKICDLEATIARLEAQLQEALFKCETESSNHLNTKAQLTQLQQISAQIQQKSAPLQEENQALTSELANSQERVLQLEEEVEKMTATVKQFQSKAISKHEVEELTRNLDQKQFRIMELASEVTQKEEEASVLREQLAQWQVKLTKAEEQLSSAVLVTQQLHSSLKTKTEEAQKVKKLVENMRSNSSQEEERLRGELESTRAEVEHLELKCIQLGEETVTLKEQLTRKQEELHQERRQAVGGNASLERKQQEIDNMSVKIEHFKRQLQEKQDEHYQIQRLAEDSKVQVSRLRLQVDQLKTDKQILQKQKTNELVKQRTLLKQNSLLKTQLESTTHKLNLQINELTKSNKNVTQQLNKLQEQRHQTVSSSKHDQRRITELEEQLEKYFEKERLLKENLGLLEYQCGKIGEVLGEKEDNQEKYIQSLMTLNSQLATARARVTQVETCYELLMERNGGLEAQIQLLNAYQPSQSGEGGSDEVNTTMGDLNKQLLEKNRDLMEVLEQRAVETRKLEDIINQQQNQELEERLQQSRFRKEKRAAEDQLDGLRDEIRRLERQLQRSSSLHDEQLAQMTLSANQKVAQLEEALQSAAGQSESAIKERQLQVELKQQQIYDLQQQVSTLEETVAEYEFKLHLANEQASELQLQSEATQQTISQLQLESKLKGSSSEESHRWKEQAERLQEDLNQLHEKEFVYEQKIITLTEKIEEHTNREKRLQSEKEQLQKDHYDQLNVFERQLRQHSRREQELNLQLEGMKDKQDNFEVTSVQLQRVRQQMEQDEATLNQEIQMAREKPLLSEDDTPMNTFIQSPIRPSPTHNRHIDDIVEEITNLLEHRKKEEELENALRLVIDNHGRQEEEMGKWNNERSLIQEKARLASKQLQKAKASFLRLPDRTMAQKSQMASTLRPTERAVGQIITLSQALSEMELNEEEGEGEEDNEI